MKFGIRKPSLKKSIKARTTGKLKRAIKKKVNPFYGKKGIGFIKNPKKALYNKVYNKTTFGVKDVMNNKINLLSKKTNKENDTKQVIQEENSNNSNKGGNLMAKVKSIIVWCLSIYSILAGICSNEFTVSNILFILAGLCIMPPVVKKVTEKTTKYSKKVKWIIFIILTLFAYGTYPSSNNVEVNNNVSQEQSITENYTINYANAESLEEDLNNGIDINGKIVKFKVREYVKDSAAGYNAHSGEHLNFISETDLNLESDVEVVGKVTSYKDFLGSWIINYEMIEIDSTAKEQAKKEAEEQAKKEAEEQAKKEAEEQAKKEAEEQAKKEAEEQAKKEAEEQAKKEAEEQAKKEAEEQAKKEAEAQAKKEAEEQARKEAEAQAKKEAEKQAQKQSSTVTVPAPETGSNLVWVPTNGGKRYHSRSSCSKMKNPNQVTKATAEANGFTPCGICY